MLFEDTVFVGIDPPSGETSIVFTALDAELNIIALDKGDIHEVAAFVGGQESAFVGINAPRRLNQGLMKKDQIRESLSPPPNPGRWLGFRVAEYLLFQRNIRIPQTPPDLESCAGWMETGFKIYRRLEEIGFVDFPVEDHQHQMMEVYPHAGYTVLLKHIPFIKKTLEGRLQRQLLLHSLSIAVPDPMRIFEEITRYKIIHGTLPLEGLYSVEELEALMAAFTAWKAALEPQEITRIGDPREGEIILPSVDLRPKYS